MHYLLKLISINQQEKIYETALYHIDVPCNPDVFHAGVRKAGEPL
jgi:hypothetical protein